MSVYITLNSPSLRVTECMCMVTEMPANVWVFDSTLGFPGIRTRKPPSVEE
jgi:hypothetical protein